MKHLTFIVIVLLYSCSPTVSKEDNNKEKTKQGIAVSLKPILEKVSKSIDVKSISYANGQILHKKAMQQNIPQFNEDVFLTGYFKAKSGAKIDMARIQQESYQLKRSGPRSPSDVFKLSENSGLIIGAQDNGDPLMKKIDVAEVSLGFYDAKKFTKRESVDYDSLLFANKKNYQLALGEFYIEEYLKQEGAMKTESGIAYEVLKIGNGPKPANGSVEVEVHYEGRLISGEVFDSSYKRGKPSWFPLNNLIKGWIEGIQLMNSGSKFRFVIPYELAYGERSTGSIPGFATLIFDVELFNVKNPINTDK